MIHNIYDELQNLYRKEKRYCLYVEENNVQCVQYLELVASTIKKKDAITEKRKDENDSFFRIVMMEQIQDQDVSLKHYGEKIQTFGRRIAMAEFQLKQVRREIESLERMLASYFTKPQLEKFLSWKN